MPRTRPSVTLVDDLPAHERVFRFTSGRLCLAFCATVGERWRRSFERLLTPGDLAEWIVRADLSGEVVPVADQHLQDARALRESIYRLVRAAMVGGRPSVADQTVLNGFARHPQVGLQISRSGSRQPWVGEQAASAALASVAIDAIDLLTSDAIGRVRECAAPDCALLFLDTSRPGKRRWCADGACGSKARSAAYRSRQTRYVC